MAQGQTFHTTVQTCGLQVACCDCSFVYYAQTDIALATRIKEHWRAVCVCYSDLRLAQHMNQFVHNIDFQHVTVVDMWFSEETSFRRGIPWGTTVWAMNRLSISDDHGQGLFFSSYFRDHSFQSAVWKIFWYHFCGSPVSKILITCLCLNCQLKRYICNKPVKSKVILLYISQCKHNKQLQKQCQPLLSNFLKNCLHWIINPVKKGHKKQRNLNSESSQYKAGAMQSGLKFYMPG